MNRSRQHPCAIHFIYCCGALINRTMIRYIYKTKDRQGEYAKPEYDGKEAPNGWNHWQHWSKKKVQEWADRNNMVGGWIERVDYSR